MTQNEIAYRKMLLEHRDRRAQNQEAERSNRANEVIKQVTNAENERTHRANEVILQARDAETVRHNVATEVHNQRALNESARHNAAEEVIKQQSNYESMRNHLAQENQARLTYEEAVRHNSETETAAMRESAVKLVRYGGTTSGTLGTGFKVGPFNFNAGATSTAPNYTYQEALNALAGKDPYSDAIRIPEQALTSNAAGQSYSHKEVKPSWYGKKWNELNDQEKVDWATDDLGRVGGYY